jgi:hypothetical protein
VGGGGGWPALAGDRRVEGVRDATQVLVQQLVGGMNITTATAPSPSPCPQLLPLCLSSQSLGAARRMLAAASQAAGCGAMRRMVSLSAPHLAMTSGKKGR